MFQFITSLRSLIKILSTVQIENLERANLKTIRRYKLGYILSATLFFMGLTSLSVVFWKAWPQISSNTDFTSTFWTSLWEEKLSLIPGIEFKLAYFIISAAITLVSGAAVLLFSRQHFFLPSKTMKLECPFCKKQWHASYDRGQVLCPHCHHLVHPKITGR